MKPTFDQLFTNITLPVKPKMEATGAVITIEEFANVELKGQRSHFSGMLDNAGFTQTQEVENVQRVVTI